MFTRGIASVTDRQNALDLRQAQAGTLGGSDEP